MRKTTSGFTIVELIAVIIVISILTGLGTLSFVRVQVSARDSQRSVKITQISEALEKYYNQKGEYPSCANMATQPANTVVPSILSGIDADVLTTPTNPSGTNSILAACADMAAGYTEDKFAYVGASTSGCASSPCSKWTLKYREESTGNIISLSSRRSYLDVTPTAYTLDTSQTIAVPTGITSVKLEVHGAKGGISGSAGACGGAVGQGGLGGKVVGNLSVTPGQQITISIGTLGTNGNNAYCGGTVGHGGTGGSTTVTTSGAPVITAVGGGGGTPPGEYCSDWNEYDGCVTYTEYDGTTGTAGGGTSYVPNGVVTVGGASFGGNGRVIITY
jgi:prepilin-type N-terminal cleavage/methylation domain-containing protein